jgi:bifunctional UDP-N-acetylglucosamine pyrophosphorylase/glucosamine-1-phosphate N-acetyltransferase
MTSVIKSKAATLSGMGTRSCLTIVLAAGEGTRMRSSRPKVLHTIAGRPLVVHVLQAIQKTAGSVAVVVGPGQERVTETVMAALPGAAIFVQTERRGTAHAVLAAREAIEKGHNDILVVFADTPLVCPTTLARLRAPLAGGASVAVLGFRPADPTGYGRLIMEDDRLLAIREEKDASASERAVTMCNAGLIALRGDVALSILDCIRYDNSKQELYLTDAIAIARAMGLEVAAIEAGEDEVRGINSQAQLAEAESALQKRLRAAALEAGVTMVAPDTVYLAADTKLAPDVTIEPYVVFGPGVVVEEGATIQSFSHLEGIRIPKGATVGPYARLGPAADIPSEP